MYISKASASTALTLLCGRPQLERLQPKSGCDNDYPRRISEHVVFAKTRVCALPSVLVPATDGIITI